MNQEKYIGMDVHQATISVAVMDGRGKPDLGMHASAQHTANGSRFH
jgi:hypothetical protein